MLAKLGFDKNTKKALEKARKDLENTKSKILEKFAKEEFTVQDLFDEFDALIDLISSSSELEKDVAKRQLSIYKEKRNNRVNISKTEATKVLKDILSSTTELLKKMKEEKTKNPQSIIFENASEPKDYLSGYLAVGLYFEDVSQVATNEDVIIRSAFKAAKELAEKTRLPLDIRKTDGVLGENRYTQEELEKDYCLVKNDLSKKKSRSK